MKEKWNRRIGDKRVALAMLVLLLFGSLMIVSAEMGNAVGDADHLKDIGIRQFLFVCLGVLAYVLVKEWSLHRLRAHFYWPVYFLILAALIACRFCGQVNGAYAWIPLIAGATVQPSEFAKVFMIIFACRLLGRDRGEDNLKNFRNFAVCAVVYFLVILVLQHDLGSAVVFFVICYCVMLIPSFPQLRKWQNRMIILMVIGIGLALFAMSPPVTEFLKKHADHYMVGRFLAAADPFLYQYDNGYHIIMSLVSFANGGWLGLGYGNSIHKYMNFPNPSNDFILPVIVEELGITGFLFLIALYVLLLYPILAGSLRTRRTDSKIVLLGTFTYFVAHFILNVGGVSGLIPLTGVPLLMISFGGSSLMAGMACLGMSQNELMRLEKDDAQSDRGKV